MSRILQTMRACGLPLILLSSGCAMMVPPEEDPLYIKQTELDTRSPASSA